MNSDECPFSPGPGQLPPILGGRDDEQKALLNAAQRLLNPKQARGASAPVLLTGPRGNGKTCLLLWFEGAIREAWERAGMPGRIRVLNLSADRLSPSRAMNALAPRGWRHFLRSVMEKVRALHPRGTPLPPPERQELYRLDLSECARSVADLYRSPETAVSEAKLMSAVQGALGRKATSKDAQAALTQLKHCGLVWPAPKQPNASAGQPSLWEAGIPSLMANIRANIPVRSGQ